MSEWVIFSKDQCPYCDKAKFRLKDEANVTVKNISENAEYFTELRELNPAARTMPHIFKDGELIGGYDQLATYLDLNKGL